MAYKQKKHRAIGDEEWMSRLRTFAALGVWPSEAGNRPAPRQKKCDTTTRTLILFCITRSNIWTDSNTRVNTFQAHFDVGIVYKATVRPSGPSAVTTSSASALPLPTTLTTTVSAAAATAASGAPAITPAAPQQQLASLFVTCCIIKCQSCHHQLSLHPSSPHHPPSHCYNCSSLWATFHDPSST
ncbi:hypothetical protein SKAU_G00278150 [Synaphobranchus kaupii]|uniref:Uncharacterized protein n=1 Tax=Synaphobranchus kaupii TaxID=118154 RepID=A0A9Q1EWF9_SYNKA|nr:hypothetical protein SKAU_G00278150 [Synaphobranchus kaupii]